MTDTEPDPPPPRASDRPGLFRFSAPRYDGPPAENHDGRAFRNLSGMTNRGLGDVIRWSLTRRCGPWEPDNEIPAANPPPTHVAEGDIRVTFINHATVLIQVGGINILTDPHWSERCSPFARIGPKRFHDPGVRFEDLPRIHLVLLSHNHYDHCDLPTLARLSRGHAPRICTGLGNARLLRAHDIGRVEEMNWWERTGHDGNLGIAFVPAQHWSGRGLTDRAATLWGGFVLDTPAGNVFFAGDTGDGTHFELIRERFGAPRLALLPIGAYLPRWFMKSVHLSPDDAAAVHRRIGARHSVAIHHGTFRLADDARRQAAEELAEARKRHGIDEDEFRVLAPGEGWTLPKHVDPPLTPSLRDSVLECQLPYRSGMGCG